MLQSLFIRNYALIDELDLGLHPGFNILTGETGAGKSLLLGALGLILGKRADYSLLFDPNSKCIIEATFNKLPESTLQDLNSRDEFDLEADGMVRIRREISPAGKSRAFVNDTPVSLQILKSVTDLLVDLHGQHENQQLLNPAHQVKLLDAYAGSRDEVRDYAGTLKMLSRTQKEIATLSEREKQARQQLDYFRFQFEELEAASLDPEEAANIEEELNLLQNAELIQASISQATDSLYHGENSLYNQLSEVQESLRKAADLSQGIAEQQEKLSEASEIFQEAAYVLGRLEGGVDDDPERLSELEARLDLYNRLKMKFSVRTVEELVEMRDEFAGKLHASASLEGQIKDLQKNLQKLEKDLQVAGQKLTKKRKKAITPLTIRVNELLFQVGLANARFSIDLSPTDGPTQQGADKITFKISTNKGMPEGPIAKIASGGEISRVMLAIKAALADKADLSVLIFDEIDSGISGEVARKVGQVMQNLSKHYQVIAITHLPQIAGKGDAHYHIYKEVLGEKTLSRLRRLEGNDRISEIATMLSGENPSASALESAREMLD